MSRQAFWSSRVSNKMRHISGVPLVRLTLLFIASVLLTLLVAGGNAAAGRLFQSPQSPPAQPAPAVEQAQPPAAVPAQPVEQAPAQPQPVDQAQPVQPEVQQVSPEQPQSSAPIPEESLVPAAQPGETQPLQDQLPLEPETGGQPVDTLESSRDLERTSPGEESSDSQNFIMDRAEFIDSVIVSGAYVWACCGIGLLLLVPIFLLVVEIRGRGKLRRRD